MKLTQHSALQIIIPNPSSESKTNTPPTKTAPSSNDKKGDRATIASPKTDPGIDKKPLPLFKTEAEMGRAERYLDRFSGNAFDPTRTLDDQFVNLRTFHDMYEKDPAFMGQLNSIDFNPNDNIGTINLEDLGDITNLDDMKAQMTASLKNNTNAQAEIGSDGDYDAYLKENVNAIAQQLGSDLSDNYEGFVSLIGDVDSFSSLNARGGVCSDIHAAITAFRSSMGQESYMVMTSGSDAAHVFNVFKDDGKWYIQNYGKVVETDAQTLSELYDIAMPEQRKIKVYGIDSDGNPKQVLTDHLTRTGRAERRFNNELGAGTFSPWHTQEGVQITSKGATIYKNGFFAQADALAKQGALGYYKKSTDEEGTTKINGFSIQGRYDKDAQVNGQHIDAKYDSEKRWVTDKTFGRSHFSVRAGLAGKEDEPVYWQNDLETSFNDPAQQDETPMAGRVGINYERNGSRVYGDNPVKFELGYQTKIGGTVTFNAKSPLEYDFVGRIYGDAVGEAKMVTGVFYQPNRDLTIRTGLASGVDLAKIDGYKNIGEQAKNIAESDAYLDVRYGKGPVAVRVMGKVPIHNPTQYKVGAGVAVSPSKHISIGATYIHEQVVNDKIDSFRVGAEVHPTKDLIIGAYVSSPIIGDNQKNLAVGGGVTFKF